jgi:hypothetical protein
VKSTTKLCGGRPAASASSGVQLPNQLACGCMAVSDSAAGAKDVPKQPSPSELAAQRIHVLLRSAHEDNQITAANEVCPGPISAVFSKQQALASSSSCYPLSHSRPWHVLALFQSTSSKPCAWHCHHGCYQQQTQGRHQQQLVYTCIRIHHALADGVHAWHSTVSAAAQPLLQHH